MDTSQSGAQLLCADARKEVESLCADPEAEASVSPACASGLESGSCCEAHGVPRQEALRGAVHGGRSLGLLLRHLAAESSRMAAGGAVDPARGEGAHRPVRVCPGRQGGHGTRGLRLWGGGQESPAGWGLRRARPASAFVSEASSPGMLPGEGRPLKTGVRSNRLFSNAYALKVKSLEVTKYTVCTVGFYVF